MVGGAEQGITVPPGRPAGTPGRQLVVDGYPRGALYPLGTDRAGVLVSSASGVVTPDVCAIDWPVSASTPLAPGSGVVAALVGMDVESVLSRLVVLDAVTGSEQHRVDDVTRVAAARTTPSGGAVVLVETRRAGLLGLVNQIDARLVIISPKGEVTEAVV
ncbi:hypothetical protein [Promicromonospora sp. NPDC057488]|uniref:hypothetical protein n=1 Tax=Promicromonospora sp. NPDC057488 TaxID=3346147 RepID=UPI00366B0865